MILYTIPVSNGDQPPNPDETRYIIYRPLAGLAFVGNLAMAELAQTWARGGIPAALAEDMAGFLDAVGFLAPDPPAPTPIPTSFSPSMAVLLLTNQCQLRCTYCYASAGEFPPEQLSLELAQIAIDTVCENAINQGLPAFEVTFHGGGEPTLAWKLIQDSVAYARRKPLPARITLTSNGIWSPKRCGWLLDNLDGLSLSMDGSPQTQDQHRPYASGKRSSAVVFRSIAEMDQRAFPYGIRMTAAAPWEDFPGDVRFLCENTRCQSFQVEPAFNTSRGGHGLAGLVDAMAFAQAFLEAYEFAAQAGRMLHYSGARLGLATREFCTAPYQALIVNPSGKLVACYEVASSTHPLAELSRIGLIRDSHAQVDQAARAHLHALIAERQAACQDCYCYWTCAGDCYTRSFEPETGGHLTFGVRCELNRFLIEKLLLRGIAEGDGAWRAANRRIVQASGITI